MGFPDMITVQITGRDTLMAHISEMPMKVRTRVFATVSKLALQLQDHVKNDKLDGQVLNHITGHLQSSIQQDVTQDADSVVGRVYSNSSVNYAGIHEYGFHGAEQVQAHIRHITQAFGRSIEPRDVMVKAHTRMMNMPERSFLRSSLADMKDQIIADLTMAVKEACRP